MVSHRQLAGHESAQTYGQKTDGMTDRQTDRQTDRRMDRQTKRQTDRVIPIPPPELCSRGYNRQNFIEIFNIYIGIATFLSYTMQNRNLITFSEFRKFI